MVTGSNGNGGYSYTITIGGNVRRTRRDGRNPSTGAYAPNTNTGVVVVVYSFALAGRSLRVNLA